jgi:hypothetical protein
VAHKAIRRIFKIDVFQPDTIPMFRLAEYMSDLATMLGEKNDVHFVKIEDGCTQLIHDVAFTAYPKVEERTRAIRFGQAPAEAMNAYRALNKKLASDNTSAIYMEADAPTQELLEFPGVNAPKPLEIMPINQPGTLIGVIQGVGGKTITETRVPVFIDTGDDVHVCSASRAIAKELGAFVLGEQRRFHGEATWIRDEYGAWALKKFVVKMHEPIEGRPLSAVVEDLRKIPSGLTEIRDPWGDIIKSRRDEGEPH